MKTKTSVRGIALVGLVTVSVLFGTTVARAHTVYHATEAWTSSNSCSPNGAYANKGVKCASQVVDGTCADWNFYDYGWIAHEIWVGTNGDTNGDTWWIEVGYTKGYTEYGTQTHHSGLTYFWCEASPYGNGTYHEHYLALSPNNVTCTAGENCTFKVLYDGGTKNTWGVFVDGVRYGTAGAKPNCCCVQSGLEFTNTGSKMGTSSNYNFNTNLMFYRADQNKWFTGLVKPGTSSDHACPYSDGGSTVDDSHFVKSLYADEHDWKP